MLKRHYLQWHILHRCNLQCKHCYQNDYDACMGWDEMISILDLYKEYIEQHDYEGQINLTGGEPLLHPDFMRLAEQVRKREIRHGILTNGTLISEESAGRLAALQPAFVQVSLDGPPEIHDRIRGEGAFEKAVRGIDNLKRKGIRVLVSFTAMKENYRSFGKMTRICRAHEVDKLWWDRVVTDDPTLFLTTEEFRSISNTAAGLAHKYSFISNSRSLQWIPEGTCSYECSAGKRLLIILANGDMMACRRLPLVIGNIREQMEEGRNLSEMIDKNPVMKKLAAPVYPEKCMKCRYYFLCRAGGRCVTYAQTGKLDAADVNCYIVRSGWLPELRRQL